MLKFPRGSIKYLSIYHLSISVIPLWPHLTMSKLILYLFSPYFVPLQPKFSHHANNYLHSRNYTVFLVQKSRADVQELRLQFMDGSLTALSCGVGQRWMGLFFLRALPLTTNYYILVLFFFECLPSWESYSDICNQQLLAVIEESHLTGWRESYIYLCYGQITKECFSFFKMLNNWSPIKSGGHNIISHRVQKCEMC